MSRSEAMGMGRRERDRQDVLFVTAEQLPKSQGHAFYKRLNRLLSEAGFDREVEKLCEPYYQPTGTRGRPSVPPGVYFRMLMVGYFEGIGSQRGIAWRCADSLSLREFLGVPLTEATPDHSTLSRVRDRLPLEVHQEVFRLVLQLAAQQGLLKGKTVAVDSTTLEADAAMKSIVRRDTGEDWKAYVIGLMKKEGVIEKEDEPSDDEVRRFDKKRKNKKVSNAEWVSTTDPSARITKLKDGRTHLAYKAEHVVDIDTELILAAEVYHGDHSDTKTLCDSVMEAQTHLSEAGLEAQIEEAVADKGYHAAEQLELVTSVGVRTYVPEPKRRGESRLSAKPVEQQRAVKGNRRRTKTAKNKRLQRLRSERVERSFAHVCDTGGSRRTWLRGIDKVRKRLLTSALVRNLGLVMRKLFGIGTPRGLQGEGGSAGLMQLAWLLIAAMKNLWDTHARLGARPTESRLQLLTVGGPQEYALRSTGC
ncbi:transposase [Pirellulimonas nuda]|nr:transposase [Pirellulimonas nuda]